MLDLEGVYWTAMLGVSVAACHMAWDSYQRVRASWDLWHAAVRAAEAGGAGDKAGLLAARAEIDTIVSAQLSRPFYRSWKSHLRRVREEEA